MRYISETIKELSANITDFEAKCKNRRHTKENRLIYNEKRLKLNSKLRFYEWLLYLLQKEPLKTLEYQQGSINQLDNDILDLRRNYKQLKKDLNVLQTKLKQQEETQQ